MDTREELLKLIEEIDSSSIDQRIITDWIIKIAQYRVTLGEEYSDLKIKWSQSYQDIKMQGLTNGEAESTANTDYPNVYKYRQLIDNTLEVMNALKVRRLALSDEVKHLDHT